MKFSEFEKKKELPPSPEPAKSDAAPPPRPPLFSPKLPPAEPKRGVLAPSAAHFSAPPSLAAQRQSAHKAYGRAVAAIRALLKDIERQAPHPNGEVSACVNEMLKLLQEGNQALVAMTAHSTASSYLYAHSVNTAILSMHVAIGMGWEHDALVLLGLSALFNDIGMIKYLGLTQKPRALTREEFEEVQLHPVESQRLLEFIHDIEQTTKQAISDIIGQERGRKAGKGYPRGFSKAEDLRLASQIIGLCDIFEAMSHPRSWREAILPSDAVKDLIKKHSEDFSRPLMQAFLERVSLFPPGSYLQLSAGEIACVVAANAKFPTRPVVEVRLAADRSPQDPPTVINLAENPLIHILRPVDETKIGIKDKKLAMALQAARWWIE